MAVAIQNHPPCCQAKPKESAYDQFFHLLEKVCAVALGVFCAYTSLELFAPFFLAGILIGFYQHASAEPIAGDNKIVSACSQSFLEQLTQVKLPPAVSLGVNLAITWCHIQHHTTIFVPVIGLPLGAWAGQGMGKMASQLYTVIRG